MGTTITAITRLVDTLGRVPFIAGVLTKGTLLVLIAACLTRLLGRSPAAARHLVWSLSVGGLLMLPAMTLIPGASRLTTLAAARCVCPAPPADPSVPEAPGARRQERPHMKQVVTEAALTQQRTPTVAADSSR
jgi:hypothetical protein